MTEKQAESAIAGSSSTDAVGRSGGQSSLLSGPKHSRGAGRRKTHICHVNDCKLPQRYRGLCAMHMKEAVRVYLKNFRFTPRDRRLSLGTR